MSANEDINESGDKTALLNLLLDSSDDLILATDAKLRLIYISRTLLELSSVSSASLLGRTMAKSGLFGSHAQALHKSLQQAARTVTPLEIEIDWIQDDSRRIYRFLIQVDHDGNYIRYVIARARDITEQRRIENDLREQEREFRTLAENAGDNIVRWDTQGRLLYANPAMTRLFGVPVDELLGYSQQEIAVHLQDKDSFHASLLQIQDTVKQVAQKGSELMTELEFTPRGTTQSEVHQIRFVPERDESGQVCSVIGFGRDISEKLKRLKLIESLVSTDPLTRLANRQALQERAPSILRSARRKQRQVAVMLLDLDEFKSVNDGLGHSVGDRMLCEVARRLSGCLRADDLLVRLGGDEFVFVMPDIKSTHDLRTIVAKLHDRLASPLRIGYREVHSTASIGVAIYPRDGEQIEQLLANADTAMYQAKRTGRARTEYYRQELGDAVRRRLALEDALHDACKGRGLELLFQPQFDLREPHCVLGAEALLRWRHPTLGFLRPDKFITLAEESGMIVPIGRWVLRTAAECAVRLNRDCATPLHLAVNVSTRQFIDDDLTALLDEILEQTGCSPHWLWIEITESALLEDSPRVQQTLKAFRQRGLRIALDDFGTGYSALNYLARFPVDCLKIDRSFIHGIGRSHRDDELAKAFIAMATALNLTTIAEGVETAEQEAFLLALGCTLVQGFRFGKPMPEHRFRNEVLLDGLKTGNGSL